MTTSIYHHQHTFTDFISAVSAVLDELDEADEAEELERHVGWVAHSCEPDYQVLVELIRPLSGLDLQLIIDLDIDSAVTAAQVIGTANDESRVMTVETGVGFLAHLVEHHLDRSRTRSCRDCTPPNTLRSPDWH